MDKFTLAKEVNFQDTDFKKSSFSNGPPNHCVMIAKKDGLIGVRDSKDPNSPTLVFDQDEWHAFSQAMANEEF